MKGVPPTDGPPEDIDEHYRRVLACEQSGPTETTRRAILAHAAQLAALGSARQGLPQLRRKRVTAVRRWKPAIFGTLMTAGLAGLLVTPHFLAPPVAPTAVVASSTNRSEQSFAAPQAQRADTSVRATSKVLSTVQTQGVSRSATPPTRAPRAPRRPRTRATRCRSERPFLHPELQDYLLGPPCRQTASPKHCAAPQSLATSPNCTRCSLRTLSLRAVIPTGVPH
jgi:hypothetical protein